MSELALQPSDTRTSAPRATARGVLHPVSLAMLGVAALTGVAMGASSLIGDLLAPPVRRPVVIKAAPSVPNGLASQWPDLKDGLPAVAGIVVKTSAAPPGAVAEPLRMAALNPLAGPAAVAPVPPRAKAESPVKRIPVPTEVATAAPPAPSRLVTPTRTAALLPPRETLRAQGETPRPEQDAAKPPQDAAKPPQETVRTSQDTPKPHQEAAKPREEPLRTRETAHKPPASRPMVATATPVPAVKKAEKVATAPRTTPRSPEGVKPTVVASASTDPEETDILGVKLPSLAPAGRKLREGVSALGDAVRNAF